MSIESVPLYEAKPKNTGRREFVLGTVGAMAGLRRLDYKVLERLQQQDVPTVQLKEDTYTRFGDSRDDFVFTLAKDNRTGQYSLTVDTDVNPGILGWVSGWSKFGERYYKHVDLNPNCIYDVMGFDIQQSHIGEWTVWGVTPPGSQWYAETIDPTN